MVEAQHVDKNRRQAFHGESDSSEAVEEERELERLEEEKRKARTGKVVRVELEAAALSKKEQERRRPRRSCSSYCCGR